MKYLLTGEETERLRFRLLTNDDFNEWMGLFENDDAVRFLGMDHIETIEEQCKTWFRKAEERNANNSGGMNVLIEKVSGKMVGQCGLLVQDVDGKTELEIGYSILSQFRNKGYATEAARKCRDVAFTNNYAKSLISIIHPENSQSAKVAQHNGMQLWKTTQFSNMSVNIYRITRDEWETR